jgi:hypothetical protein
MTYKKTGFQNMPDGLLTTKRSKTMKRTVLTTSIIALAAIVLASVAQSQTLIDRAQLRRTADPSDRSGATGSVTRRISPNGQQTFEVQIKGLGEDQYGIFATDNCANFDTNCPVAEINVLNRTSAKRGVWYRKLLGINTAPAEFVTLGYTNLADILIGQTVIAQPDIPDIVTSITNIVGGVTNISGGVTNIVGSITNIVTGIPLPSIGQTGSVFATLWAPLRPMTTKPNLLSFNLSANLYVPDIIAPPNLDARGTVKTRYVGPQGRSVIEVHTWNMIQGQKYTVFIADQTLTNMIPAGDMTFTNKTGDIVEYIRDTKYADPLPHQVGNIEELTGRRIEVRDSFYNVHLEGIVPGPTNAVPPETAAPAVSF